MRPVKFLIASALCVWAAFGGTSDQLAEERHKAKYGRHTPAEEKRRELLKKSLGREEAVSVGQACCRSKVASIRPSDAEEWHRMKFGRSTPAFEAAKNAADVVLPAHGNHCTELGRCSSLVARNPEPDLRVYAGDVSRDTEARLRIKLGITGPKNAAPETGKPIFTAREHTSCAEPCCTSVE